MLDKLWGYIFALLVIFTGAMALPEVIDWIKAENSEIGASGDLNLKEFVDVYKNGYSITYNLDGGTAENPKQYNLFTATFTLNNPIKQDYAFLGWTNEDISEPKLKVTILKGSSGDIEFTANYLPLLDTPSITLENTIVFWNAIENAEQYKISINDKFIEVESTITQIDLSNYKSYLIDGENLIKVMALNNSYKVDVSSAYSEPVIFTTQQLAMPYATIDDKDIISWYPVENADYYNIEFGKYGTSETITSIENMQASQLNLAEYFEYFTLNEKYWIKISAHSYSTSYLASRQAYFDYTYVEQKDEVDLSNLSNYSGNNKGYFVDELVDGEHTGTLFIQLEDVDGNVWGFGMTDTGIGDEYYSCGAEDITIYQLNKENEWGVYTITYPEQVAFFETTQFLIDDDNYFKFINIEESRFDNALYCFTHYFAMMFDTVNSDRQHRTTSLGYTNSYECVDEHTITLTDSLFSCIQTYSKTTNEIVSLIDGNYKLNFADIGKV